MYAPPLLKHQLQCELNDPIVTGLQSAVAADIAEDLPEVCSIEVNGTANIAYPRRKRAWSVEIDMVGKVESFRTDLD